MNRKLSIRLAILGLLSLLIFLWTSCFRRYDMTDTDLDAFYHIKKYKPRYKSYKINDRTVHYAEVGSDTMPLLLFIHGAPGAWFGYIHLLDDSVLQQNFQMISVDRPGYGKSDYGIAEPSIENQACLLQPLIDSYKIKKPIIIVGRSYGAPIAAKLVSWNQDKVKALIMLGPAIDPEKEKFQKLASLSRLWFVKWMMPKVISVAAIEKKEHVGELNKMLSEWKNIKVPTSVLIGSEDWIVDTANLGFARKVLVNSRTRTFLVPNTGHLVSNERPDLVKKEIFAYLREIKN